MHITTIGIGLFVFGVIIALLTHQYAKTQSPYYWPEDVAKHAQHEPPGATNRIGTIDGRSNGDAEPPISQQDAYRKNWREYEDLRAQQQMALWAYYMLIANAAGIIVTGVGIFYVAQTLRTTQDATQQAAIAAQAAADTVKIAKQDARAWLAFRDGEDFRMQLDQSGVLSLRTRYVVQNKGRSLARKVAGYIHVTLISEHADLADFLKIAEASAAKHGIDVIARIAPDEKALMPFNASIDASEWLETPARLAICVVVGYDVVGGDRGSLVHAVASDGIVVSHNTMSKPFYMHQRDFDISNEWDS